MNSTVSLTVENLLIARGDETLLDPLGFSLGSGKALVLKGVNGVGKTTLLRVLAGFLDAVSGSITLSGINDDERLHHIHYLGHQNALKGQLTASENLQFWADFYGGTGLGAKETLDSVGLQHACDLPAGILSAGQQRRLSFARLLLDHRPLWLLDEPTAALDARSERTLFSLCNDHLARGGMIVAATHSPLEFSPSVDLNLQSAVKGLSS